jgi:hypothetical protein
MREVPRIQGPLIGIYLAITRAAELNAGAISALGSALVARWVDEVGDHHGNFALTGQDVIIGTPSS